jgi:hypothetical protein
MPVRGRLINEVESIMGFFNNLLPLNLKVESSRGFSAWLGTIREETVAAFANQDVPFEMLAGEPEFATASQSGNLYQSLFSFQDARHRTHDWGGLRHQSVLVMQKGATEDFGLWLMDVPHGLEGGINYNADVFDSARRHRSRPSLHCWRRLVRTSIALSSGWQDRVPSKRIPPRPRHGFRRRPPRVQWPK